MKKIRSVSTKADAEARAEKIRAYWSKRGVEVTTSVVKSSAPDGAVWEIESDLINGLPRKGKK
jgi:hypothetical protein